MNNPKHPKRPDRIVPREGAVYGLSRGPQEFPANMGVPQPGNAEDYQQFMLGLYDMLETAQNLGAVLNAVEMLTKGRLMFLDDFEAKHPGYGKGRAVWR